MCLCVLSIFLAFCHSFLPLQNVELYNIDINEMLSAMPPEDRKTLIVMGIPYRKNEDCRTIAKTLFEEGLQIPNVKIISVKRVQFFNGIPGVLQLKLESVDDKLKALEQSKHLRNYKGLGRKVSVKSLTALEHSTSFDESCF